jgi:hypothetical protein
MIAVLLSRIYAEVLSVILGALMGIVAFLGLLDVVDARRDIHHLAYALARLGFVVLLSPLLELIFKAPSLTFTWELVAFTVGAVMMGVGYVWIIWLRWHSKRISPEPR